MTLYYRAVTAYLKVVRQRKSSSADGKRGGEQERVIIPPLVGGGWGPPRDFFLNFERFCVRYNEGFYALAVLVTKIFLVA